MSWHRFLGFLGVLVVLTSCSDQSYSTTEPGVSISPTVAPDPQRAEQLAAVLSSGASVNPSDDMHSFLNAAVPGGVGGVFTDGSGGLFVYLKDLTHVDDARSQLVSVQGSRRSFGIGPRFGPRFPAPRIQFLQGRYDWDELRLWYERILELPLVGVHGWDLDESRNRIHLYVSEPSHAGAVREILRQDGVPSEAVLISVEAPAELTQAANDLKDTDQPTIRAGFDTFVDQTNCTLGANVKIGGGSTRGFLTAAHCTDPWGASDGGDAFQAPYPTPGWRKVGDEISDPSFFDRSFNPSCPLFAQCRWSDVALFEYDQVSFPEHGVIARTLTASIVLDSNNPDWYIQDDDPGCILMLSCGLHGDYMWKLGITTGFTVAQVDRTCEKVSLTDDGVGAGDVP